MASEFEAFLKENKKTKKNTFYAASKNFIDKDGNPLKWEIRPITTRQNDEITENCMKTVPIPGKPGQFRRQLNEIQYSRKLVVASIVKPDLNNKQLQDSYGVMKPEDLVVEMIDNAGEFNALIQFINEFNGFTTLQEDVDEAKNS